MQLDGITAVVTGGGSGIGAAIAEALLDHGAGHVVICDVDTTGLTTVSQRLGDRCSTAVCDVTKADAVDEVVDRTEAEFGPIDLLVANAGIATGAGIEANDATWNQIWAVNVMGIVHCAQSYLRVSRPRGAGHLLITASAAGLLTNLGDAPYTATKHAAVGLAEWIAITHGPEGIGVSCLCPMGVRTPMVTGGLDDDQLAAQVVEAQGLIEPADCAAAVIEGLSSDRFLILPHPEVHDHARRKADDPDRWIGGMQRLQRRLLDPEA